MTKFEKYIGMDYDPTGFNCWDLVQLVQREQFGRDLPDFTVDGANLREVAKAIDTAAERENWHRIDAPNHGCCVLMRRAKSPIHVGIWLDIDGGGILHNVANIGVVFQHPRNLIGVAVEGYYAHG